MLSRDAIEGMFAKRKAPDGGPTEAVGKKKKKKAAGAGPSRPVPEPVVGLEAPRAPTEEPEPEVREEREASQPEPPVRAAAQPAGVASSGQSVSTSTGRRPEGRAGGRARRSAYRLEREGTVRVAEGESVVHDPAMARRMMGLAIAPRDEAELGSRSTREVLMSSFAGLVLAAHNVFSLERAYEDSQDLARRCTDRVAAAAADRDAARESARVAKDRVKGLEDEVARLKSGASRATQEAEAARRRLAEVQLDLDATRTALGSCKTAVETAQSETRDCRLEVLAAKQQTQSAILEAEASQMSAINAVEVFKASADYAAELVASSRLFYVTGFANCKREIGEAFPILDLSAIEEPVFVGAGQASESEEEETESEGETTEGAPTAEPPAGADQAPPESPQILLAPTEFEMVDLTGGSVEETALSAAPSGEPTADPDVDPVGAVVEVGAPESSIV